MDATSLLAMAADPAEYRKRLLIDTDDGARTLASVADPWQTQDFAALDRGWQTTAGIRTEENVFKRAYLERGRGHSKSNDLAVMASWALAFSQRQLAGVAAAGDKDQARLLRDAIARLVRLNRWLGETLDIQNYRVVNTRTGSTLDIISSDAGTSYGLTPHFIVCDELTNWKNNGDDLWASLLSAAAKRRDCMFVVISNAGLGQGMSWQWKVRESARTNPEWYFSRQDGPVASWITPDRLDEQRKMLPSKAFSRLWLNLWTTATGDCLDPTDVEACITLKGPQSGYDHLSEPYIGALDLGLKNDHSAFLVLAADVEQQRLKLVHCESWAPPVAGGQISLMEVERAVLEAHHRFRISGVVYDPWQCGLMAERLRNQGIQMAEFSFTPKNLNIMATSLMQVIRNRQIDLYRDEALLRDLMRLTIVERQSGFKIESTRDANGHCDRASALAMAIPWALHNVKSMLYRQPEIEEYLVP